MLAVRELSACLTITCYFRERGSMLATRSRIAGAGSDHYASSLTGPSSFVHAESLAQRLRTVPDVCPTSSTAQRRCSAVGQNAMWARKGRGAASMMIESEASGSISFRGGSKHVQRPAVYWHHNAAEPTSSLGCTCAGARRSRHAPLRGMHPANTFVASMISSSFRRSPTNPADL